MTSRNPNFVSKRNGNQFNSSWIVSESGLGVRSGGCGRPIEPGASSHPASRIAGHQYASDGTDGFPGVELRPGVKGSLAPLVCAGR
jgi:hypothetical protein